MSTIGAAPVGIPRLRLWELLDSVPRGGVGLVVGPAGSGKSVLVSQWVRSRTDIHSVTLVLSSKHDDAVVFATALVDGLGSAVPGCATDLMNCVMTGGASLGEVFVDRLAGELADLDVPLVIVLDDAHTLGNRDLLADLERLMAQLPETTRLLMSSRWDMGLRTVRLRMAERVVELRDADLRFTAEEAQQLVDALARREIDNDIVRQLVDRTAGWAAGLQLAAISIRDVDDAAAFAAEFAGTDRLVVEYLTEEVLDRQDDVLRRFLLDTSVLPWLSAELCAAVTGRPDAEEQLRRLSERSLFVAPTRSPGGHLRYHQLFADLLRFQLAVERPGDERALRLRAARWLHRHGHEAEAVEEYLAAGEPLAAFDLISGAGQQFFERGEWASLSRWLTRIIQDCEVPPAVVEVSLLAAQTAGDETVAAAETFRRLSRRPEVTAGERAAASAIHACLGFDDLAPSEVLAASEAVRSALPSIERDDVPDFLGIGGYDSVELIAEFMAAVAHFHQGDLDEAAEALGRARGLPGMAYAVWRIYVLGALALVRAWSGRLTEADQLAVSCLAAADEANLGTQEYVTYAYFAAGLVATERLEFEQARRCLGESALRNQLRRDVSFFDVQRHLEARLAAVSGHDDEALARLGQPARSAVEPILLSEANHALTIQIRLRQGDMYRTQALLEHPSLSIPPAIAVEVALAGGDVERAEDLVHDWHPDRSDVTSCVERALRASAVAHAHGDASGARELLAEAVALAEPEGLRRPLADVPMLQPVLRETSRRSGESFVRAVLDDSIRLASIRRGGGGLVEALTERELAVLRYLPSRLSNSDIAGELYVSTNTVKTHVRSIYRKLGAPDRNSAVERAIELGLL